MATERKVEFEWIGDLMEGEGKLISTTSGKLPELDINWLGRQDEEEGLSSPDELLAAAHASDFTMALVHGLVGAGWSPEEVRVTCTVSYETGIGVTGSHLVAEVEAEGIPDDLLREVAERAKATCPLSKALAGIEITLELPGLPPEEEEEEPEEEYVPVGEDE